MGLTKFITKKNLKALDKELQRLNYDELLKGLSDLLAQVNACEDYECVRAVYAMEQVFLTLKREYDKEDE